VKPKPQTPHASDPVTTPEPNQAPVTPQRPAPPLRLIRLVAVCDRIGVSKSTVWRLERKGAFPRHHRISPNTVGWLEHEVEEWIRRRLA
jgi:prophage regulatory protein